MNQPLPKVFKMSYEGSFSASSGYEMDSCGYDASDGYFNSTDSPAVCDSSYGYFNSDSTNDNYCSVWTTTSDDNDNPGRVGYIFNQIQEIIFCNDIKAPSPDFTFLLPHVIPWEISSLFTF